MFVFTRDVQTVQEQRKETPNLSQRHVFLTKLYTALRSPSPKPAFPVSFLLDITPSCISWFSMALRSCTPQGK